VDLPPQRQKQRTIEVLHDQLAGLAEDRPVLSVYEDVHWADPSTLELLESMVAHVQQLPVLLVLTFRPEFRPAWGGYPHVTALTLSRLPQRRASSLIEQLTAAKPLPPELVQQIIAKTDGVPLFIEELTKVVLESRLIRDSGDRFVLAGPLSPLAVPATLQDSLMARLDRLAPVKEVAQIGAAIGREFSYPLLRAIAGRSEDELRGALDQLVTAELVFRRGVPPLATYSFKHALVQEAAYESLLRSRRRELHATIARTLSSGEMSGPESSPEVVAEHFTRAGLGEEAARHWLEAGRRAKAAYANREAASHLEKCLDVLESTGQRPGDRERAETEADALTLLGDLAGLAGDLRGANRRYDEALSRVTDSDQRTLLENKVHHQDFVVRDGARIAFYRHGGQGPVLLLVNPLVYGLAVFQPVLDRLCQEFRIITIDSRGTGDSDPLRPPFPLREHAADVARVIEAVGGPVVGVGLSRGSNLLIRLAVERPDLLSALVTVDCPLLEGGFDGLESFSGYWVECPKARQRGDAEALLRILSTYMYTEPGAGELQRSLVERGLRLPSETVLSFYDPDPDVDVSALLGRVRVPTLVTHGREDQIIPLAGAEYLSREIPEARLHVFEGKGHLPIFTATDEFCAVLRDFLGASPGAAATVASASRPAPVSGG
jgi:pimeloyl-ACP methyl ester carboxylesterase